jgi:hypothetical protein
MTAPRESVQSPKMPELALWWLAVLGGGFFVPGLGLLVGVVLAFTRYRHDRPMIRWGFVAVGAAMLVFQIVSLEVGFSNHGVSPAMPVS